MRTGSTGCRWAGRRVELVTGCDLNESSFTSVRSPRRAGWWRRRGWTCSWPPRVTAADGVVFGVCADASRASRSWYRAVTSGRADPNDPAPNVFRFEPDGAQWVAGLGDYAYRTLGWRTAVRSPRTRRSPGPRWRGSSPSSARWGAGSSIAYGRRPTSRRDRPAASRLRGEGAAGSPRVAGLYQHRRVRAPVCRAAWEARKPHRHRPARVLDDVGSGIVRALGQRRVGRSRRAGPLPRPARLPHLLPGLEPAERLLPTIQSDPLPRLDGGRAPGARARPRRPLAWRTSVQGRARRTVLDSPNGRIRLDHNGMRSLPHT